MTATTSMPRWLNIGQEVLYTHLNLIDYGYPRENTIDYGGILYTIHLDDRYSIINAKFQIYAQSAV